MTTPTNDLSPQRARGLFRSLDSALSEAVSRTMQARWPALPLLRWEVESPSAILDRAGHSAAKALEMTAGRPIVGRVGVEYAAEVAEVALRWAEALGLERSTAPDAPVVAYLGTVDGVPIRLWGVVDVAAWDEVWEAKP